jgi:hypothetical protein
MPKIEDIISGLNRGSKMEARRDKPDYSKEDIAPKRKKKISIEDTMPRKLRKGNGGVYIGD